MKTITEQRTNEAWLADLRSTSIDRQSAAHRDLHDFLSRGLVKSLAGNSAVDRATLEDFAQDALLRVLAKVDTFRGTSKFTTWAMSIALRVAFTELRRHRWKDTSLDQFEGLTLTESPVWSYPSSSPAQLAQRNQIVATLYRTINQDLTDRQRTVLLAELQGVAAAVIEEQLGINRNALYKLTHDARKRLRAALFEADISPDAIREAFAIEST